MLSDNNGNKHEVVVKLIYFCKDVLEIPEKSFIGVAEVFISDTPDKHSTANGTNINSVKKADVKTKNDVNKVVLSWFILITDEYKILRPVLLIYKWLFDEHRT